MKKFLIIETVLCIAVAIWFVFRHQDGASPEFDARQTVDDFVALQPIGDYKTFAQLMNTGAIPGRFDVNKYFTVLDKLSPEPGYVLDWVYWRQGGMGGLPVLYIRKSDAAPYTTLEDYAAHSTNADVIGVCNNLSANRAFFYGYLDKIHIKDSAEGFFQFVVLRLLADRFYLFWHELYREIYLVCSPQGWDAQLALERDRGEPYTPPPDDFVKTASKIDFSPRIHMGDRKVEINVTTYAPFDGLELHYFAISRKYPHTIYQHTKTNILRHTQGFMF